MLYNAYNEKYKENEMRAIRLRTEYLKNPMGLGIKTPRLFWNDEGLVEQKSYEIRYSVNGVKKDVKRETVEMFCDLPENLKSRDEVSWQVRISDENGNLSDWSEKAFFEMGLLEQSDFKAKWISGNYKPKKSTRYPVDCFRKTFKTSGKIRKARLYMSALGIYEAKINGKNVSDVVLAPGATDYRKRVQYQTYDVTELLQNDNEFTVELADGWYRGSVGAYGKTAVYGRELAFISQLEIYYENGEKEVVVSDSSFDWSNDGCIRFADLKDGEIVDRNMTPSYSGKAKEVSKKANLVSSDNVSVKKHEKFLPKLIITPSGKKVLDFSQNIAGFIGFNLTAKKGSKVTLLAGEIMKDGEFTQENFQLKKLNYEWNIVEEFTKVCMSKYGEKDEKNLVLTPLQKVEYICKEGNNDYETKFAIFGFRYVLVETDVEFSPEDFYVTAVYSDIEETVKFRSSNENVNKIVENTRWSVKGNFADVPTDCPTRERMGWTGDAQIFYNAANYFVYGAPFYRKFIRDMLDERNGGGMVSAVVPMNGLEWMYYSTGSSAGWADALVLIPYRQYLLYRDERVLKENYEAMKKFGMFLIKNAGGDKKSDNPYKEYLYCHGVQLGEWLEPKEYEDFNRNSVEKRTEEPTAYFAYTLSALSDIARVLGEKEDEKLFEKYSDGAKKAYRYKYLKEVPDTDRQAKLVRPIALGLFENDDMKKALAARLALSAKNRNYHVATGFLSTVFLLGSLSQNGYTEEAYKILLNDEYPGWINEIRSGATTIWEDWEGKSSNNHYSPGAVCEWIFSEVGGVKVVGARKFEISPKVGGGLSYSEIEYQSPYGKVACRWEKKEEKVTYKVVVPANCKATFSVGNVTENLTAGEFEFIV